MDEGMTSIHGGWTEKTQAFITLLRTACSLKLMSHLFLEIFHLYINFSINIFEDLQI